MMILAFSNSGVVELGYNCFVFDIKNQQNFKASQANKVEFKFGEVVPNDMNCYALVLTNNLISASSVGRRRFDLI